MWHRAAAAPGAGNSVLKAYKSLLDACTGEPCHWSRSHGLQTRPLAARADTAPPSLVCGVTVVGLARCRPWQTMVSHPARTHRTAAAAFSGELVASGWPCSSTRRSSVRTVFRTAVELP